MKKQLLNFALLASVGAFFAFQNASIVTKKFHKIPTNNNGASGGSTGAPGESNCTSCHNGTVQSGATENVLVMLDGSTPVTQYTPGATYTMNFGMSSNVTKKGFQATAFTPSNTMAGTFTAGSNTSIKTSGSKKYAGHTNSSNTGTATWNWTWTAPTTNVGTVTFYVASNKSNNNNNDNGDVIYLSQHTFQANTSDVKEKVFNPNFKAWLNDDKMNLKFNSLQAQKVSVNVVDLAGKSVAFRNLGYSHVGENNLDFNMNSSLPSGMYMVQLFLDNTPYTFKVYMK